MFAVSAAAVVVDEVDDVDSEGATPDHWLMPLPLSLPLLSLLLLLLLLSSPPPRAGEKGEFADELETGWMMLEHPNSMRLLPNLLLLLPALLLVLGLPLELPTRF